MTSRSSVWLEQRTHHQKVQNIRHLQVTLLPEETETTLRGLGGWLGDWAGEEA